MSTTLRRAALLPLWNEVLPSGVVMLLLSLSVRALCQFLHNLDFADGVRAFRNGHDQYLLGAALNWQINPRAAFGAYLESAHTDVGDDHLLASHAEHPLTDLVGIYAGVAWQDVAESGAGSVAGADLTWQCTLRVELDAGFSHHLGDVAEPWPASLGAAYYFDR